MQSSERPRQAPLGTPDGEALVIEYQTGRRRRCETHSSLLCGGRASARCDSEPSARQRLRRTRGTGLFSRRLRVRLCARRISSDVAAGPAGTTAIALGVPSCGFNQRVTRSLTFLVLVEGLDGDVMAPQGHRATSSRCAGSRLPSRCCRYRLGYAAAPPRDRR